MFKDVLDEFAIYVPESSIDAYKASIIIDTHIRSAITAIPEGTE